MLNNIIASLILSAGIVSPPPAQPPQGMPFSHFMQVQERPQVILYYTSTCPYSKKVLNYLNQIHKTVTMKNLDNNPLLREELRKIGGKTQVPCLVINGKALYESNDIITWLSRHQSELESDNGAKKTSRRP